MKTNRFQILAVLAILFLLGICVIAFRGQALRVVFGGVQTMSGKKTVAERVAQYGATVRQRLAPRFAQVAVSYPPARVTLIGIKNERILQVWVAGEDRQWRHLKDYPILGMSGNLGPKLREGDRQVPEGLYRVESLNPNSLYHLALRVNYPNTDDVARAKEEGRMNPGSDIMIHGNTGSVGCLAMGDQAAEDLFVLAAETGIGNLSIILSPVDFRRRELPSDMPSVPAWTKPLYQSLRKALDDFKEPVV